jgi:hypothetical protein
MTLFQHRVHELRFNIFLFTIFSSQSRGGMTATGFVGSEKTSLFYEKFHARENSKMVMIMLNNVAACC